MPPRILFLVHGVEDASVRYRVLAFLPALRAAGAEVEVEEWPLEWGARRALPARAAGFDTVVVQRKLLRWFPLRRLRRRVHRLVYDFDDALWLPDSAARRPFSLTRLVRFRRMVRRADAVVAGSPRLAAEAARLGARPVVIPTAVDTSRYGPRAAPGAGAGTGAGRPFRVGWIGSHVTLFYLEDVLGALEEVARRLGGLTLVVVSDRFPVSRGVMRVEERSWSEATEAADLATLDVGLMPLRDDRWSAGKCGLKLLQYMSASLPVVASPVGVNVELVRPGVEGLYAPDGAAWVEALLALAADAAGRERMGEAARRRVEAGWSLAAVTPRWLEVVLDGARA
ncbi:MAG: glycosyltransferase family 4 protein [Planctomycetes bacterium]|nr:glycosyltransferase family 4 protein [Planctomycetota bacterium]